MNESQQVSQDAYKRRQQEYWDMLAGFASDYDRIMEEVAKMEKRHAEYSKGKEASLLPEIEHMDHDYDNLMRYKREAVEYRNTLGKEYSIKPNPPMGLKLIRVRRALQDLNNRLPEM